MLRDRGLDLHEAGDLAGAEACYREFLAAHPADPEVSYALGVLALQTGRYATAAELLTARIAVEDSADARGYLGGALLGLTRPEEALTHFDAAVRMAPEDPSAHLGRGQALQALGRTPEALASLDRAVELQPAFLDAALCRAELHVSLHQVPQALADYEHAVRLRPDHVSSHVQRGRLFLLQRQWADALASIDEAMRLGGSTAELLVMRGMALQGLARGDDALHSFTEALARDPRNALACSGAASMLLWRGRARDALELAERALSLRQPFPSAQFARACALEELGRTGDACDALERAIAEDPGYVEALAMRASLRYSRGDAGGARDGFRQVLQLDPAFDAARMGLAIAHIPVIPATQDEVRTSREGFRGALLALGAELHGRRVTDATLLVGTQTPFALAYQESDNRELLTLHGDLCAGLMADWQHQAGLRRPAARPAADSRIRVGIVSAHVHRHSVHRALTDGWIQRLDRKRFEVEIFHLGLSEDGDTRRAQAAADHYVNGHRSTLEWTQLILDRAPAVLIYPEIGMDTMTVQLASQRLAPVQAAAWGHPETSGLPTIDYFLSAELFEPADADRTYRERLVRLPGLGSWFEPTVERLFSAAPADRGRSALPVFVCAGAPFKYAPDHDQVLVDIARRIGPCEFHFFSFQDGALSARLQERMTAAFSAAGLDAARYLVLNPWATQEQFHDHLSRADLMLDPLGFSGFNTVVQALECHLPVVTYRGKFMRGRLGTGILERLGLGELVADSPASYVELAAQLVRDADRQRQVRSGIRDRIARLYRDDATIGALQAFLATAVATGATPG